MEWNISTYEIYTRLKCDEILYLKSKGQNYSFTLSSYKQIEGLLTTILVSCFHSEDIFI